LEAKTSSQEQGPSFVGGHDGYVDHDDYYITLLMTLTIFLAFCLLMHVIGANIIPGLIKMAKIIKIRINCQPLCP
jgi:hypothetical protein